MKMVTFLSGARQADAISQLPPFPQWSIFLNGTWMRFPPFHQKELPEYKNKNPL